MGVGQFALYREDLSQFRGAEVRRLQTRLNNLDYLTGSIDGQIRAARLTRFLFPRSAMA